LHVCVCLFCVCMCCMARESDHVIMNVCLSFGADMNIQLPHCWRGAIAIAIAMHNATQCNAMQYATQCNAMQCVQCGSVYLRWTQTGADRECRLTVRAKTKATRAAAVTGHWGLDRGPGLCYPRVAGRTCLTYLGHEMRDHAVHQRRNEVWVLGQALGDQGQGQRALLLLLSQRQSQRQSQQ
jgi:hypothetical protein